MFGNLCRQGSGGCFKCSKSKKCNTWFESRTLAIPDEPATYCKTCVLDSPDMSSRDFMEMKADDNKTSCDDCNKAINDKSDIFFLGTGAFPVCKGCYDTALESGEARNEHDLPTTPLSDFVQNYMHNKNPDMQNILVKTLHGNTVCLLLLTCLFFKLVLFSELFGNKNDTACGSDQQIRGCCI